MGLNISLEFTVKTGSVAAPEAYFEVFNSGITHNLTEMAEAAGLYLPLWRPNELGAQKAGDLIDPIANGLETMHKNKKELLNYSPENNWGSFDDLLEVASDYLAACRLFPLANIYVDV